MPDLRRVRHFARLLVCMLLLPVCACQSGPPADPVATLNTPSLLSRQHRQAIEMLAQRPADEEEANAALERAAGSPGCTLPIREEALRALAARDLPRAKRTLRNTLPNATSWAWVRRASEIITEEQWIDLTPALVSSWARVNVLLADDLERPEYRALAQLHGEDQVTNVVFQTFRESSEVSQQSLRTRCWQLLFRLGQRQRLVDLLNQGDIPPNDALLLDLRAASRDLGLVPRNREEILWLRSLRQPQHEQFWSRAAAATSALPPERRAELEIRDLPVIVSASLHDPQLLTETKQSLQARVEAELKGQKHHIQQSDFEGFATAHRERLSDFRKELTWGDFAAILIARRAMQVPQVIEHLFDFAARDRSDKTTEYGGVIRLDAQNRFEILEFPPVVRRHDEMFIASQEMLDAAYDAVFHFHFHAQSPNNSRYAGPGFGDANYADNTRANCLVLTSVKENVMNVDYYRHGRVVIDLGEIRRP